MSLQTKHILLVANCNSPHIQERKNALVGRKFNISEFSLADRYKDWFSERAIDLYSNGVRKEKFSAIITKSQFTKVVVSVKEIV